MTGRNGLLSLAMAAALSLGLSSAAPSLEQRVSAGRRRRDQEREEYLRERAARAASWAASKREKERRSREIVDLVNAGIDPTNGRPLSRQQRRSIARKGYYA